MEAPIFVTAEAPVNIAVIKYWGKRDEKLILPCNGSISATLDLDHMRAKTTVAASSHFASDRMWLNGAETSMESQRLQNVIREIRRRARKRHVAETDNDKIKQQAMLNWKLHICSQNNFPTAAGLASSAAGFSCLVFALAKLFGVEGDVSDIARLGSGSACRSMFGGFVEWTVGCQDDGSDSVARQIVSESHWSDMRVLILVVSAGKKHVGSTDAMQTSVSTSKLLEYRAKHVVPQSLIDMTSAIHAKDFDRFAELTMKDSNQMHAVCLDTYPPVAYLTDTSMNIIRMVHAVNGHFGECCVSYTFDAGPNACLYLPESSVAMVLGLVEHFFPPPARSNGKCFFTGLPCVPLAPSEDLLSSISLSPSPAAVEYVIYTKVGPGPRVVDAKDERLLDYDGLPLETISRRVNIPLNEHDNGTFAKSSIKDTVTCSM